MEVVNGTEYTIRKTATNHDILVTATGRERAQCLFCDKVKDLKFVGACYNNFHGPFSFPIHMCNACSKASGFDNGNAA